MHPQGAQVDHDRSVRGGASSGVWEPVYVLCRFVHHVWRAWIVVARVGSAGRAVGQGSGDGMVFAQGGGLHYVLPSVDGRGSVFIRKIWQGMGALGAAGKV